MTIKAQVPEHLEARVIATALELACQHDDFRRYFPAESRILLWDLRDKWREKSELAA